MIESGAQAFFILRLTDAKRMAYDTCGQLLACKLLSTKICHPNGEVYTFQVHGNFYKPRSQASIFLHFRMILLGRIFSSLHLL